MKTKTKFILAASLLLAMAFIFSCSHDSIESRAGDNQKQVYCRLNDTEAGCSRVSKELCDELGGTEVKTCAVSLSSSSDEGGSSSSVGVVQWYCVHNALEHCEPQYSPFPQDDDEYLCPDGSEKSEICPFPLSSSSSDEGGEGSSSSEADTNDSSSSVEDGESSSSGDGTSSSSSVITSDDKYCIFASAQYCTLITTEAEEATCTTALGEIGSPCPEGYTISGGSSSSSAGNSGIATTGNITFTGLHTTTNPAGQYYFIDDVPAVTGAVTVTDAGAGCSAVTNVKTTDPATGVLDAAGKVIGAGTIIFTPTATCNSAETPFPEKAITATAVPNPTVKCVFGTGSYRYMHKGESFVIDSDSAVTNNYGRCTNIQYSINDNFGNSNTYPLTNRSGSFAPRVRATCPGSPTPITENCSEQLYVADRIYSFDHVKGTETIISLGTSVIEMLDEYDLYESKVVADKLSCGPTVNSNTFDIIFNNNGQSIKDCCNDDNEWWINTHTPSYAETGNRFLLTANQELKCTIDKY